MKRLPSCHVCRRPGLSESTHAATCSAVRPRLGSPDRLGHQMIETPHLHSSHHTHLKPGFLATPKTNTHSSLTDDNHSLVFPLVLCKLHLYKHL